MAKEYAVEILGAQKSFDGVAALKHADFQVEAGTCHGLIGENGAGKSTLMKILTGIVSKDAGTIRIYGKEENIRNKFVSESKGIALVPQELDFISNFTVAENIYLGIEPKNIFGLIHQAKLYENATALLNELQIDLDPKAVARDLNVSQQQMMVIAKILARDASILIMDEPTARLGHDEIEHLLKYINHLKNIGKTIIFISHHLDEIMNVCDRVTVLRDGTTIMTEEIANVTVDELIQRMVDREIAEEFRDETGHPISEVMLHVEGLKRTTHSPEINFEVRKGEIIGFFGLVGSGRTEMIRAALRIDKRKSGTIILDGKKEVFHRYSDAIQAGVVLVPEERRKQGVILNSSIKSNISIGQLDRFVKWGMINRKEEQKTSEHSAAEMSVSCHSLDQPVKTLSGGNQQKVVLAKHVESDVKVFILDEPTRGIDIGAKDQIYNVIEDLVQKRMAVIVISSEIPELQRLCDAVYVMHEGKITRRFERHELKDAEKILQYALAD